MNPVLDSQILAVDVGNSEAKFGRFTWNQHDAIPTPDDVFRTSARSPDFDRLREWLPDDPSACYLTSVYRKAANEIVNWLQSSGKTSRVQELSHLDFPLRAEVQFPERVGQDRLASALAAGRLKRHDHAAIVVDAGSAITVDAVSIDGTFLGGAILAGQRVQAAALSQGTDLLPMLSQMAGEDPPDILGDSTEDAIRTGIFWGTVGSIREIVKRMKLRLGPRHEVMLTGGDMHHLARHVAPDAHFLPQLVLSGIALAARHGTQQNRPKPS